MDDGEVTKEFRDWTIADASDEKLLEILRHLCSETVPNESVRHRELLRGITINHIQMSRMLQRLDKTLKRHETALKSLEADSRWIKVFAIVTGALTLVLVILTIVLARYPLEDLINLLSR
jgi:hypothetical protein